MTVDVWRVKSRYSFALERVIADKLTPASVFIKGSRSAKFSDGVRYFESFSEAKTHAIALLQRKIEQARKDLREAERWMQFIEMTTEESYPTSDKSW